MQDEYRDFIQDFAITADTGVRNATLEETARNREKYWRNWCKLAGILRVDPELDERKVPYQVKARALTIFGGAVRKGVYGNCKQVAKATVSTAISAIGTTITMDGTNGKDNPVMQSGSKTKFIEPVHRMLQGFGNDDPATTKKLPVDIDVPEFLCDMGCAEHAKPKDCRVGLLCLVAFYFLLRVGEYTSKLRNGQHKTKKTVNFRVCDVTFFKTDENGRLRLLPPDATPEERLSADGATLRLMDQKNGWKNVCIHQQSNGKPLKNPVVALAMIVNDILSFTEDRTTWLSAFQDKGRVQHVVKGDISSALKFAAEKLDYPDDRIIPIDRIDTHSLRCGGANALSLAGYKEHQIQKMGRWRGKTFKEYISDQLSNFTDGMSEAMSRTFKFVNIAAAGQSATLQDVTDDPNYPAAA